MMGAGLVINTRAALERERHGKCAFFLALNGPQRLYTSSISCAFLSRSIAYCTMRYSLLLATTQVRMLTLDWRIFVSAPSNLDHMTFLETIIHGSSLIFGY